MAGPGIALQSDGKILVNGFALSRYDSNGNLDTSFGIFGIASTPSGVAGLALQSNGSIVAAGSLLTLASPTGPQLTEFAVLRYTTSGVPDVTFGSGGGAIARPASGSTNSAAAVAIQSNGSIVAADQTGLLGPGFTTSNNRFDVARFTSAGQLDATFGTNDQVSTSFGGSVESPSAVVIQPDGKILVVGSSAKIVSGTTSAGRFALARYLAQ